MAKYALLIGMSEYESQKINNLSGVVKDIEAMQRVLQNSDIGGFDEVKFLSNPDSNTMRSEIEQLFMEKCQKDDVVLLYFSGHGYRHSGVVKDIEAMQRVLQNSGIGGFDEVKFLSNPDSDTMRSEIEQLFMEKCQKDDVVLLYFSGHGYTDEDGNLFFISRNTQVNPQGKPRIGTAVDAKFIHQNYMSRSKSKRQVLILDCCFSGAFAEGMSAKKLLPVSIENEIGEQLGGEGRAVLTSSTATQQSFEDSGGGVYTRYLVEGIEKGAAEFTPAIWLRELKKEPLIVTTMVSLP